MGKTYKDMSAVYADLRELNVLRQFDHVPRLTDKELRKLADKARRSARVNARRETRA